MDPEIVSKTQRKREMHELQALGEALVELPEAQLRAMALDPGLLAAILEAKRIKSHEAKRRQMQYIGQLMRDVDAAPIRARMAELDGSSAQATARHRRLEAWRERLIGDDEALDRVRRRASRRRPAGAARADPQRAQGGEKRQAAARLPRAVPVAQRH